MNSEEKNLSGIILFIIIILVIGIGGFFLITHKNNNKQENNNTEEKSIKIDENKSYIYFTNEIILSEHNELVYKDININMNSNDAKELQTTLNNQMNAIKNNVIKIEDANVNIDKSLVEDGIYEAEMIDYIVNESNKYVSLTVHNYIYRALDDENENSTSKFNYYVFDIKTGKLLENKDILVKENITDQEIRSKIRNYLKDDDSVDIDATLNTNYYLTITKNGKIVINTLVKTNNNDYNVSIEMD